MQNMMSVQITATPVAGQELEMPPDDLVESWGENEQLAIEYSINQALKRRGCTYADLAKNSGMNKSQLSLMRSGERGVPVGRFCLFVRATGSLALPKLRAAALGCVLKTKSEWGAMVRDLDKEKLRASEAEAEAEALRRRLERYESS